MISIDSISFRRAILDWRDNRFEETENRLARELNVLFSALDSEIDKMEYMDFINGADYTTQHLQPIYTKWATREVKELVEGAEKELRKTYQALTIQFCDETSDLAYGGESTCGTEVATITLAGAGALVAIPAFASWSVVSAGGLAGWLGATVISWPVVIAGIAIGGLLVALSATKATNLKANICTSIKKNIRGSIRGQVLGNEKKTSVCQRLHDHYDNVANAILKEIPA